MLFDHIFNVVNGLRHFNAQGFGLFTAGNGATIIVGEYHHRLSLVLGLKDPLTRHIKIIAIYQGIHRPPLFSFYSGLSITMALTTPHTSKDIPSVISMGRYFGFS